MGKCSKKRKRSSSPVKIKGLFYDKLLAKRQMYRPISENMGPQRPGQGFFRAHLEYQTKQDHLPSEPLATKAGSIPFDIAYGAFIPCHETR